MRKDGVRPALMPCPQRQSLSYPFLPDLETVSRLHHFHHFLIFAVLPVPLRHCLAQFDRFLRLAPLKHASKVSMLIAHAEIVLLRKQIL